MPKVLQNSALRQIHRLFGPGTVTGLSDAQLLERFASDHDQTAFEMLIARHGPMVLGVCLRVLHNPHDAEDAFQATFLVLARKADSLWVKGSLASWLYQIAVRIAVQVQTDAARRRRHEQQAAGAQKWEQMALAPLEPDLFPMLCREIDRLPEKYRAPVVLCHLEELTHEEAAQVLRCTVGTVHGRLARARELLRRRLTRRGVGLPAGLIAATLAGSGSHAVAAAVPLPLRNATHRAAMNLAAGQGITAAGGSATVAALLAAALRTITLREFKSAAAVALTFIAAVGASVLVGKSLAGMLAATDEPARPAAASKPPPRNDSEAIQDTWMVVEIGQVNHQPTEDEKAYWKTGQLTVTITADRLAFDVDKSSMSYRLDPSMRPKQMMLTATDGPRRGNVVALAIYSLEGDDLKICIGRGDPHFPPQPPHGFDIKSAPRGTFPTLFVMKRKTRLLPRDPAQRPKSESTPESPIHPHQSGPLHSTFDGGYGQNLPGGRKEPLFVDLDTGRFMTPPFALEPADLDRPLILPNLAFPQKLRDWIRFQGIDAAVQTDGQIITLMGLEMEEGERMPLSAMWSSTPADALERINRIRVRRLPREELNHWPLFVDTLKQEDPTQNGTHDLPFLTREGGIGMLSFRMDHQNLRGPDGIRLDCRLERGLALRFEGGSRFGPVRRTPEPPILGMFAGPLVIALQDEKMILKLSGGLERIEVGQGKVVVRAGQTDSAEVLLEAARLATFVMKLDGRRDQGEIFGRNKTAVLRREGNIIRVSADGPALECERITLGLPELTISSVQPDVPNKPKAR